MRRLLRPILTHGVAWSVCRSVTIVSPTKAAEPIEMPFGLWTRVGRWGCTVVAQPGKYDWTVRMFGGDTALGQITSTSYWSSKDGTVGCDGSGARCILLFLPRTLCAIALSMWTFEEMVVNEWTVAWPFFRLESRVLLIEILARRFRSIHEVGSKLTQTSRLLLPARAAARSVVI